MAKVQQSIQTSFQDPYMEAELRPEVGTGTPKNSDAEMDEVDDARIRKVLAEYLPINARRRIQGKTRVIKPERSPGAKRRITRKSPMGAGGVCSAVEG
eukprot:2798471-Alexandrium_andersonii.AAC.1